MAEWVKGDPKERLTGWLKPAPGRRETIDTRIIYGEMAEWLKAAGC